MPLDTTKSNSSPMVTDHPAHHNALAAAVNTLLAQTLVTTTTAAGGSLTGLYPNPTVAPGAITTAMLATGAATGSALGADVLVTSKANTALGYAQPDSLGLIPTNKLGTGTADSTTFLRGDRTWVTVSSTGGSPTGAAGGALTGTYPNPSIAAGAISTAMISAGAATGAALGPDVITTGTASGGDLTGNYPGPAIGAGKVTTAKLAPGAATGVALGTDVVVTSQANAANGYPQLGANALVPTARLGTGTAAVNTYLRGDQSYGQLPVSVYTFSVANTAGLAAGNYVGLQLPASRAGTVVKIRSFGVGASGSYNWNIGKNGTTTTLHSGDITSGVNTWVASTTITNATLVTDDALWFMITSIISGTITQIQIQVEVQV